MSEHLTTGKICDGNGVSQSMTTCQVNVHRSRRTPHSLEDLIGVQIDCQSLRSLKHSNPTSGFQVAKQDRHQ